MLFFFGGMQNIGGNPYLNSAAVLFDILFLQVFHIETINDNHAVANIIFMLILLYLIECAACLCAAMHAFNIMYSKDSTGNGINFVHYLHFMTLGKHVLFVM